MKRGRKSKDLVGDEFKGLVAAANSDELKTKVVNLSKNEEEILRARSEDVALTEAKESAKELNAPYAETLKEVKAKRRYVLTSLKERGQ